MNIFEQASRKKLRFPSVRGDLTVENLWDMPLEINSPTRDIKFDLETVAQTIDKEISLAPKKSFVSAKADTKTANLELQLEIVKHIIAVKLKEREDAVDADKKADRRRKLLHALESQEERDIMSMSKEDILKELQAG